MTATGNIAIAEGWTAPRQIETRAGRRTLRTQPLNSEDHPAWKAWRHDKAGLRAAHFGIGKVYTGRGWEITHWQSVAGQFEHDIQILEKIIADADANDEKAKEAMRIDYVADHYEPLRTAAASKLFEWQRPSCQRVIHALKTGNALDASQTGAGKTFVALAACAELGLTPYVIAPLAVLESWRRAAHFMGVPLGDVSNYDKARAGSAPFIEKNKHAKRKNGEKTFRFTPTVNRTPFDELMLELAGIDPANARPILILDECQKIKGGSNTEQGKIVIDVVTQGVKVLCLSATAAKDPTEMHGIGLALGLHKGDQDYRDWMKRNGCKRGPSGYFFTDKPKAAAEIMQRIHSTIFPARGTRIRSTDVPGYPENAVTAHLIENAAIADAYGAMQEQLAQIEARKAAREIDAREAKAGGLAAIMKARRESERGKLDFIIDETKELLADGFQAAIFLNFREHLALVRDGLKLRTAPVWGTEWLGKEPYHDSHGNLRFKDIDGRAQKPEERTAIIDAFQAGKSKVILVSLQAGGAGISLHDDRGIAPRQSIISPSYSIIDLIQALGRIWRAGSHSKASQRILFASGTIEEEIAASIQAKCENIERLNEGDLTPQSLAQYLDIDKMNGAKIPENK